MTPKQNRMSNAKELYFGASSLLNHLASSEPSHASEKALL